MEKIFKQSLLLKQLEIMTNIKKIKCFPAFLKIFKISYRNRKKFIIREKLINIKYLFNLIYIN